MRCIQIKNGDERPIAFMSRKLNTAQRNYTVTEWECLAAVLCVKEFRCFIKGMPFTIITKHASLKWLMEKKNMTGRLARWSLELQQFDFKIEHRKGAENVVPDALSRAVVNEIQQVVGSPLNLNDDEFKSESYQKRRKHIESNKDNLPDIEVRDNLIYKRTDQRNGINDAIDSQSKSTFLRRSRSPTTIRPPR